MSVIDSLLIEIGVDAKQVADGINQSRTQAQSFADWFKHLWQENVDAVLKKTNETKIAPKVEIKPAEIKEKMAIEQRPRPYLQPAKPRQTDYESREDYEKGMEQYYATLDKLNEDYRKRLAEWEKRTEPAREYNRQVEEHNREEKARVKRETEEAEKAQAEYNQTNKDGSYILSMLTQRLKGMAAAFVSIGALTKRARGLANMYDLSRELRMSVEDISAWGEAFSVAGYKAESAYDTLRKIQDGLRDVKITGQNRTIGAMAALLGYDNLRKEDGTEKNATELLLDTAKKLRQMDQGTARYWAEQMGFDDETITVLTDTRVSLEEVYKIGQKLSDPNGLAKTAKDFQASWGKLMGAFVKIGNVILGYVLPPITFLFDKLADLVVAISQNDLAVMALTAGMAVFAGKLSIVSGLVGALKTGFSAFLALGSQAMKLNPFLLAITAIGLALKDVYDFFTSSDSVIEAFLKKLGLAADTIQSIKDFFKLDWLRDKQDGDKLTQGEMWDQISDPSALRTTTGYYTSHITINNTSNIQTKSDNPEGIAKATNKSQENFGRNTAALMTADMGVSH